MTVAVSVTALPCSISQIELIPSWLGF